MKFENRVTQDNAVKFAVQVQDDLVTFIFTNLAVLLPPLPPDQVALRGQTATCCAVFKLPLQAGDDGASAQLEVEVEGFVARTETAYATALVSIAGQSRLIELPLGIVHIEAGAGLSRQKEREADVKDPHSFRRTFSVLVPPASSEVLVTCVLLAEQTQLASDAHVELRLDTLSLALRGGGGSQ